MSTSWAGFRVLPLRRLACLNDTPCCCDDFHPFFTRAWFWSCSVVTCRCLVRAAIQVKKFLKTPKVAPKHVAHAFGNAMNINCLYRLLPRALFAAGLIDKKPADVWKHMDSAQLRRIRRLPDDVYPQAKL